MDTLKMRLDEAEIAYHDLMAGKAVVEVRDQNGETVRYQQANRSALAVYIAELRRKIMNTGTGPMQFWGPS